MDFAFRQSWNEPCRLWMLEKVPLYRPYRMWGGREPLQRLYCQVPETAFYKTKARAQAGLKRWLKESVSEGDTIHDASILERQS